LVYRAAHLDLKLPLLESAMPSNERHLRRAIEAVLDLPAQRIGVIGLAFKEDTDDLRESPVVTLLEQLIGKGRDVKVFDPRIRLDAIYGSNRNFVLDTIPHIGRLLTGSLDQILAWADHLVLAQIQTAATMRQIQAAALPILDLVGGTVPLAAWASDRAARPRAAAT
jgi:GDP-mannose 6-dehydrogenase